MLLAMGFHIQIQDVDAEIDDEYDGTDDQVHPRINYLWTHWAVHSWAAIFAVEADDEYDGNDVIYTRNSPPTFPAPVLEPDLVDAVFSDVFSNLNTGLPKKKPPVNKIA